jgi:hypothetical protein
MGRRQLLRDRLELSTVGSLPLQETQGWGNLGRNQKNPSKGWASHLCSWLPGAKEPRVRGKSVGMATNTVPAACNKPDILMVLAGCHSMVTSFFLGIPGT